VILPPVPQRTALDLRCVRDRELQANHGLLLMPQVFNALDISTRPCRGCDPHAAARRQVVAG
jgi:hypothetical protein